MNLSLASGYWLLALVPWGSWLFWLAVREYGVRSTEYGAPRTPNPELRTPNPELRTSNFANLRFLVRNLVFLFLLLALANPTLKTGFRGRSLLVLLDVSGSVAPLRAEVFDQIDRVASRSTPLPAAASRSDELALIVFGADAAVEIPFRSPRQFSLRGITTRVDTAGSNLDAALSLAAELAPEDGRSSVLLLSDGRETQGNAREAALRLSAEGVRLYTAALDLPKLPDVAILDAWVPEVVREGEANFATLRVRSSQNTEARIVVNHLPVGEPVPETGVRVELRKDEILTLSLPLPDLSARPATVDFRIEALNFVDRVPQNDRLAAVLHWADELRVLHYRTDLDGSFLQTALGQIPRVISSTVRQPESPGPWDVAILENIPTDFFSADRIEKLRSFVELEGGGLIVTGIRRAFAAGGYPGSVLERLLPVRSSPPERSSVCLVLDHSASMNEPVGRWKSKWQLVCRSFEQAVALLDPEDELAAVLFSDHARVEIPLGKAGARRSDLRGLEERLPRGPTHLAEGLRKAADELQSSPYRKVVFLLSDLELEEGALDLAELDRSLDLLRDAGSSLWVLLVQPTAARVQPALERCRAFGARVFPIEDPDHLGETVEESLGRAVGAWVEGESLEPKVADSAEILDRFPKLPEVNRLARTWPKERSLVEATVEGHPLVAAWKLGRGRVVAVPIDLHASSAPAWLSWQSLAPFWGTLISWAAQDRPRAPLLGHVLRTPEGLRLELEVPGIGPADFAGTPLAEIEDQHGRTQELVVLPGGPTLLGGSIELAGEAGEPAAEGQQAGFARIASVRLYDRAGAEKRLLGVTPVAVPYSREWEATGADRATLRVLAELGGGEFVDDLDAWQPPPALPGTGQRELRQLLVFLALLVLLMDLVVVRR